MTMQAARVTPLGERLPVEQPGLDSLGHAGGRLRVFCGPHEEYLESEPARYFPLEVHYPEGQVESKIG